MGDPSPEEMRAFLQGKLLWLDYLNRWLEEHPGTTGPEEAWEAFKRDHPDAASGPGFVRPE